MEGMDDPVAELARVRGRKRFTMAEYAQAKARTRRMVETTDNPSAGKPQNFQSQTQAQPPAREFSRPRTIAEVAIDGNSMEQHAAKSRDATPSGDSVCVGPQFSSLQQGNLASAAEITAPQQAEMLQSVDTPVLIAGVISDSALSTTGKETGSSCAAAGSVATIGSLTPVVAQSTESRVTGTNVLNKDESTDFLPQERNCIVDSTAHGVVMGTENDQAMFVGTGNQVPASHGSADASAPVTEVSHLTAAAASTGEKNIGNSALIISAATNPVSTSGDTDVAAASKSLGSAATTTKPVTATSNIGLNPSFVDVGASPENDLISTEIADHPTPVASSIHEGTVTSAMNSDTCSTHARGDGSAISSGALAARALRSSSRLNNQNAANPSTLNSAAVAEAPICKAPVVSVDAPVTVAVGVPATAAPPVPRRRGRPPGSGNKKRTDSAANAGDRARDRVTSSSTGRRRHNAVSVERDITVNKVPTAHGCGGRARDSPGNTLREDSSVLLGSSDCQRYGDGSRALGQGVKETKNTTSSTVTAPKSRGEEKRGHPPPRKRRRVVDVDALDLEAILGRNLDDYARKQEYHRLLHRQKEQFDRARSQRMEARKKQTRGFKDVDCSAGDNMEMVPVRNFGLRTPNSPPALSMTGAAEAPSVLPTDQVLASDGPSSSGVGVMQEDARIDLAAHGNDETGRGDRSVPDPETGQNRFLNGMPTPSGAEKNLTNSEAGNYTAFGSNAVNPVSNGSSNPEFSGSDTIQVATLGNEFSVDGLWGIENRAMPELAPIPSQSSAPRKGNSIEQVYE